MERSKRHPDEQKKLDCPRPGSLLPAFTFAAIAGTILAWVMPVALADGTSQGSAPSPFVSPMAPSAKPKAPASTGKGTGKGNKLDNGPHAQAEPPIQATQPIQNREPIQPRQ